MHTTVQPRTYIALQLPSGTTKIVQIIPNTTISLGKYGSFPANQIIGRPYFLTFEILDQPDARDGHVLRVVSAAELHAEELIAEGATPGEGDDEGGAGEENLRTNRNIVDDTSTQKMTMDEIEALKQGTTGAGREIIAKLLASHSALDQKTAFSRAKYTLRKRKKYLKRFTVLPLDVPLLTNWMLEQKDAAKVMELRGELLGLIGCWANVHYSEEGPRPSGRWLVVDDTGGLVVAAMAERMGILYKEDSHAEGPQKRPPAAAEEEEEEEQEEQAKETEQPSTEARRRRVPAMSATHSTLTLIHPNIQPNLTLLEYFNFDINDPDESHPLHTHLKTLTWLQLLDPQSDSLYAREPPVVDDATLASWKSNRRGAYYRKRRRFERIRAVVDETRAGGFDGLIVASLMDPVSILKHTVPLLSGSAPVVVYSPYIEPLVTLADLYSTARRTAFIVQKRQREERQQQRQEREREREQQRSDGDDDDDDDDGFAESFPVDPTLLLGATVQTSRVRTWQVLPGRTHPLMTGRGGAEGYVFHATRVIPAEGKVEARGMPGRKKRKVESGGPTPMPTPTPTPMTMTTAGTGTATAVSTTPAACPSNVSSRSSSSSSSRRPGPGTATAGEQVREGGDGSMAVDP
ncbi:hypothetical protein VTO42DRAFT_6381 [Malbranchea cinnamomea]